MEEKDEELQSVCEGFRCFWETIELEKGLETPKKFEPIPMSLERFHIILYERLQKIEFGVRIYDGEAICPNGHIEKKQDYFEMDYKYCTKCGEKLLTVTNKEHWEPCRLMILPIVPEGTVSTEYSTETS